VRSCGPKPPIGVAKVRVCNKILYNALLFACKQAHF
jgi:hypothetical protein